MGKKVDLIGESFGQLTVTSFAGMTEDRMTRLWLCVCDCGGSITVPTKRLRNKMTKSCGCLMSKVLKVRNTTHGMADTPLYRLWSAMHSRCYNPNNEAFHRYGGRGIYVDDRWHSFENFMADVGEKPKGLSLDRLNNDGPYSAINFRWATYTEQNSNRRDNVFVKMPNGEAVTKAEACRRIGVSSRSLDYGLTTKGIYKGVTLCKPKP